VTPRERKRHKDKLLALKAEILQEGDLEIAPTRKDDTRASDQDEQPLTEMSQVIASKRNQARASVIGRVVAALQRLEEQPEEFGLCGECGDPIGKRLELMPYVELCVECQQERDGDPKKGPRRHLTDFK
jgi:DnaK suppressor protein